MCLQIMNGPAVSVLNLSQCRETESEISGLWKWVWTTYSQVHCSGLAGVALRTALTLMEPVKYRHHAYVLCHNLLKYSPQSHFRLQEFPWFTKNVSDHQLWVTERRKGGMCKEEIKILWLDCGMQCLSVFPVCSGLIRPFFTLVPLWLRT